MHDDPYLTAAVLREQRHAVTALLVDRAAMQDELVRFHALLAAVGAPGTLQGVAAHLEAEGYPAHAAHLERIAAAAEAIYAEHPHPLGAGS